jgi:hypothetical protein
LFSKNSENKRLKMKMIGLKIRLLNFVKIFLRAEMSQFHADGIMVALICAILTALICGLALIALVTGRNSAGKMYSPALRGDIRTVDAKLIELRCLLETHILTKRGPYTARTRTKFLQDSRAEFDYLPEAADQEPQMPMPMPLIADKPPFERTKSLDFSPRFSTFTAPTKNQ